MKIYRVRQVNYNIIPIYDQTICYCSTYGIADVEMRAYCHDYQGCREDMRIDEINVITPEDPGRSYIRDLFRIGLSDDKW